MTKETKKHLVDYMGNLIWDARAVLVGCMDKVIAQGDEDAQVDIQEAFNKLKDIKEMLQLFINE